GYHGFVRSNALTRNVFEPTHKVSALSSPGRFEPLLKLTPRMFLPHNARVRVINERGSYVEILGNLWLPALHVRPRKDRLGPHPHEQLASAAERYLDAPYTWGGKTFADGIDCSGLVQQSFDSVGVVVPRNTSEQKEEIAGVSIPTYLDLWRLERGDLIFFDGH